MHSDALAALGWAASHPLVRDAVPALARGNNLVVVAPPAPAHAAPVLAGVLAHRAAAGGQVLVLAPAVSLAEWSSLIAALAADLEPPPLLALGVRAAERRLRGPGTGLLITSPATGLALRERAALAAEQVSGVVLAWPESWEDREVLTLILQDVPREAQRVIVTADPDGVAPLVERHAWRAMIIGAQPLPAGAGPHPVRLAPLPWAQRLAMLPALAEQDEAGPLTVWTADASHHTEIGRALAGTGREPIVTTDPGLARGASVAFDPPTAAAFSQLAAAGPLTLLAPPGTEAWLARLAPAAAPLAVSTPLEQARTDLDRRRARIDQAVRETDLEAGFAALGPVFERHDPASVAAALYHLWREAAARRLAEPAAARPAPPAATARIWVGAGKRDDIGVGDLVGLLSRDLRVDRASIGRVELRETFSLVEVPAGEADRIAQALTGKSLRKRRLVARVDRKAGT